MEFLELRKAATEEIEKQIQGNINTILEDNKESSENVLNWYLTDLMRTKYKKGEISREFAVEKALKRLEKEKAARIENAMQKIQVVEAAKIFNSGVITVEWKKSSLYGHNPTANFRANYNNFIGKASGCGYDKESAAVANALNQCNDILYLLYSKKNENISLSNSELFSYGSGYGILPYFEGGVGVSCFQTIFEELGYSWKHVSWTDSTDVYTVEKKVDE